MDTEALNNAIEAVGSFAEEHGDWDQNVPEGEIPEAPKKPKPETVIPDEQIELLEQFSSSMSDV